MSERLLWIWLSLAVGIGSSASDILLEQFDYRAEDIYNADESDFADIPGISEIAERLKNKDLTEAKEISAYCQAQNIGICTPDMDYYPQRLRSIRSRPILLYFRGNLIKLEDEVCVAMVGTRGMSQYGSQSAYSFGHEIARCGGIVVSGMAKGVDSVSHRGALDAGGYTVAVFGCGIDKTYPPENTELMNEIIRHGVVISEFKPLTPPYGQNFPIRNRIISGLSQATLVVECGLRSGALITAKTALYQGRDLFALPGKVGEQTSEGTNHLLHEGARIVTSPEDILSEYTAIYPNKIDLAKLSRMYSKKPLKAFQNARKELGKSEKTKVTAAPDKKVKQTAQKPPETSAVHDFSLLDETERRIYDAMQMTALNNPDRLAQIAGGVNIVLSKLTMLEIKGFVKIMPGGLYMKL